MDKPEDPGRRRFLKTGLYIAAMGSGVAAFGAGGPLARMAGAQAVQAEAGQKRLSKPFPLPWLDRDGNHNQTPGPGKDPSSIFHFKGMVARANGFSGMGKDNKGNRLAFGSSATDFSFMSGLYWAAQDARKGAFSHISLALFSGPAAPSNLVHDLHPGTSAAGLFRTVPVTPGRLLIGSNGRSAELELEDIAVMDQPGGPFYAAPSLSARMSLRVIWKALAGQKVRYEDKCRHFKLVGHLAACHAWVKVEVPYIGFSWQSDPIGTSKAAFAVIGEEVNGKYYDEEGTLAATHWPL